MFIHPNKLTSELESKQDVSSLFHLTDLPLLVGTHRKLYNNIYRTSKITDFQLLPEELLS